MRESMKQRYGLIRRPWGVFYLKDKLTGNQTSLKTADKHEATRLLAAENESEAQPALNLGLARVYMNGADPKLVTRTWQEVMEGIVAQKTDETRRRCRHRRRRRLCDPSQSSGMPNRRASITMRSIPTAILWGSPTGFTTRRT